MNADEARAIIGAVFCPTCKQDTIPSDRTGECFFCDRLLVAKPEREAVERCGRGHEWTPANELWYRGKRSCRMCKRARNAEWRRAQRAAA